MAKFARRMIEDFELFRKMFDKTMDLLDKTLAESFDDITEEFDTSELDDVIEKKTEETENHPDGTVVTRTTTIRRVVAKKP